MNITQAKTIIEKKYKGSHATGGFKTRDGFVFSLKPDDWDDKKTLMDPFFKVKNNGSISEYSPYRDLKEWRAGLKAWIKFEE